MQPACASENKDSAGGVSVSVHDTETLYCGATVPAGMARHGVAPTDDRGGTVIGTGGRRTMGTVEFGLILPENPWRPPARERYLEDVNRLLAAANGSFASAWCIDHLQGDVLEGWTTISYLSALHPG